MRFFVLLCLGIALIGIGFFRLFFDPIGIGVILEHTNLSLKDLQTINEVTSQLTNKTDFAGKVNINKKVKPKYCR